MKRAIAYYSKHHGNTKYRVPCIFKLESEVN